MLLEEQGLSDRASVLATDICRAALARASRAAYGAWSLRGPSATDALPYLRRVGKLYQVAEGLRRRVVLQYLNLALDVYPSFATGTWGMDLILCRNVLIYFDPETVRNVARRLCAALAEGGWLLTASSDPPLGEIAPMETVVTDEGVCYRKPARGLAPEVQPWEGEAPAEPTPSAARQEPRPPSPAVPSLEPCDAEGAALHVRALANLDTVEAESACAAAVQRYPLATELGYLLAVLRLELGRLSEAVEAIRRVLYLDRSLALAHFTLGAILHRTDDRDGARRAYRNARELCMACPRGQILPLSDGETAGRLAEAAEAQLAFLVPPGSNR
jgi:chemotaxis protein methyltransferase CheR